jgi:hypothetical protein
VNPQPPSPVAELDGLAERLTAILGVPVRAEVREVGDARHPQDHRPRTRSTQHAVLIETDSATVDDLVSGGAGLLPALITGRLAVVGDSSSISRFWEALALLDRSNLPPAEEQSILSEYQPLGPVLDRFPGFPPDLSHALMDQMLVTALLLAGLPSRARTEELTRLWSSFTEDGDLSRHVLARIMVSLADLAAGNTEHANLRDVVRAVPAEVLEPSWRIGVGPHGAG